MAEANVEEGKEGETKTKMQVLQEVGPFPFLLPRCFTDARYQIFQKKKDETSSTTSTKPRESHFKVVAKRDSILLPETGHPSGWVNRAAEREELVHKGEGWKSEAFNIVS
jgi:hypothetical protein